MIEEKMKIKIWTVIFIFFFSGYIFGQNKTPVSEQKRVIDSVEIKLIEKIIDSIQLEKTLQEISIDSVSLSSKFYDAQEFYKIDYYYRNNEIVKISINPCKPLLFIGISSSSIDFFMDKNKLIFVNETFTDNSMPGQCGKMEKQNQFYYFENTLIEKVPNVCSHICCDSFIDKNWLIDVFNNVYKISKERINRNINTIHNNGYK